MLYLVLFIFMLGSSILLNAFVTQHLWAWFLSPVFPSLAVVSEFGLPFFIGLALLIAMLAKADTSMLAKEKGDPVEQLVKSLAVLYGTPLFTLLIGYIVKSFM